MFFSKLKAMSVGTLWVLRRQEQASSSSCCSVCGEPWMQPALEEQSVIAVFSDPITDEAQQKLLGNCLNAAGWYEKTSNFFLHAACSANNQTALATLQTHLAIQTPKLIIVFGHKVMPSEFIVAENTRCIVTHHPQEMLANPALKAQVWVDFCSAME